MDCDIGVSFKPPAGNAPAPSGAALASDSGRDTAMQSVQSTVGNSSIVQTRSIHYAGPTMRMLNRASSPVASAQRP